MHGSYAASLGNSGTSDRFPPVKLKSCVVLADDVIDLLRGFSMGSGCDCGLREQLELLSGKLRGTCVLLTRP